MEEILVSCPYCGEAVDLSVDEDGGASQIFVEDCPVCCRPWEVEVSREPEGNWIACLRTLDE